MQTAEKEAMLKDLYSLRAGMSLISIEKDKIDLSTKKSDELKNKEKGYLMFGDKSYETYPWDSTIQKDNGVFKWASSLNKPYSELEKTVSRNSDLKIDNWVSYDCTSNEEWEKFEHVEYFLGDLEKEENYNAFLRVLNQDNLLNKKRGRFWLFSEIARDCSRYYKEGVKIAQRAPEVYEKLKSLEAARQKEIAPFILKANDIYSSMYESYGGLIDPRDWKYLDLITFYLETGRADSMKEALQQVDRQVQTDDIIKEIRNAAEKICRAINDATSRICGYLSQIVANQRTMIAQNEVQTALLAKAACASQQLASDVRFIREFR